MQYLGEYRIDDYITFGVQLHRFSSGAVYAPTGNATYTFYENNSTSGAPTGGNLAQLNSKTGLYTARVQLTTAAGFEAGKEYLIHVEATVDSVAAAELLGFRVIAEPTVDVVKWLGTAAATPSVAGVPEVDLTYINGAAATGAATPDVNVVTLDAAATAAIAAADAAAILATPANKLVTDAAGNAAADLKKVNAIAVDGAGTEANPWGPA